MTKLNRLGINSSLRNFNIEHYLSLRAIRHTGEERGNPVIIAQITRLLRRSAELLAMTEAPKA